MVDTNNETLQKLLRAEVIRITGWGDNVKVIVVENDEQHEIGCDIETIRKASVHPGCSVDNYHKYRLHLM